jgi:hypothetical protein
MTDPDEIGRAVAALAEVLESLSVRWAVGGSIASAAHGEPRATNDVDVIAALTPPSAREVVERLGDDFYGDVDAASDAARRHSSFNVIDNRSFIKLDIFVPRPGPLGVGQLDRARPLDVFPGVRPIPVLGPEDIVLQKLQWYRASGGVSDRQWRDIVSVLRIAGDRIDHEYLDGVADESGLTELLRAVRADASG